MGGSAHNTSIRKGNLVDFLEPRIPLMPIFTGNLIAAVIIEFSAVHPHLRAAAESPLLLYRTQKGDHGEYQPHFTSAPG